MGGGEEGGVGGGEGGGMGGGEEGEEASLLEEKQKDAREETCYGWLVVTASFLCNMVIGINYLFSFFTKFTNFNFFQTGWATPSACCCPL